ncbi:disintegrin and metalloproteinase domain-containing protein 28-like [Hippoglossus stenolepis]|uniref:disintegrin and metalloproteinase domain-containing protein 28-like n=1 Tax=Hippoglossus stenolepis TaxID=195615 RepID=UPI00159C0102|nr:disintegrin and metalloproteinase domain-containing protein 28-like [Hippoglossus stenolepis]
MAHRLLCGPNIPPEITIGIRVGRHPVSISVPDSWSDFWCEPSVSESLIFVYKTKDPSPVYKTEIPAPIYSDTLSDPCKQHSALLCYNHNTRGIYYGFCKRLSKDQYIPCQQEDTLCGKLFCHNGNPNPNYGRMVSVGDCKATFYDDYTKDYGQVDTGTICGDGKVCSENQCVDLVTAYRNTNCSAKCPGHAVCNHRSECQCLPGWMPPSCISEDGDFSALSPGAVVAISVTIILVVLGIILGVIGFIWKKRQRPILPTSHTQRKLPAGDRSFQHVNKGPAPGQVPQPERLKPKAPPPPPPGGRKPKPPSQNYMAARQALRPVPPPKV